MLGFPEIREETLNIEWKHVTTTTNRIWTTIILCNNTIWKTTCFTFYSLVMEKSDLHHKSARSVSTNFNGEALCFPSRHSHVTVEQLVAVESLLHWRIEEAIKTECYARRDKTPVNRDSIRAAKRRNLRPCLSAPPSPLGGQRTHNLCSGSETCQSTKTTRFERQYKFIDWQKINSFSKNKILELCYYLILTPLSTSFLPTEDRLASPPRGQRFSWVCFCSYFQQRCAFITAFCCGSVGHGVSYTCNMPTIRTALALGGGSGQGRKGAKEFQTTFERSYDQLQRKTSNSDSNSLNMQMFRHSAAASALFHVVTCRGGSIRKTKKSSVQRHNFSVTAVIKIKS